jgi:hypothetical protein
MMFYALLKNARVKCIIILASPPCTVTRDRINFQEPQLFRVHLRAFTARDSAE